MTYVLLGVAGALISIMIYLFSVLNSFSELRPLKWILEIRQFHLPTAVWMFGKYCAKLSLKFCCLQSWVNCVSQSHSLFLNAWVFPFVFEFIVSNRLFFNPRLWLFCPFDLNLLSLKLNRFSFRNCPELLIEFVTYSFENYIYL